MILLSIFYVRVQKSSSSLIQSRFHKTSMEFFLCMPPAQSKVVGSKLYSFSWASSQGLAALSQLEPVPHCVLYSDCTAPTTHEAMYWLLPYTEMTYKRQVSWRLHKIPLKPLYILVSWAKPQSTSGLQCAKCQPSDVSADWKNVSCQQCSSFPFSIYWIISLD